MKERPEEIQTLPKNETSLEDINLQRLKVARRVSRPFLHRYRECASVVQHIEPPLLEIDAAP